MAVEVPAFILKEQFSRTFGDSLGILRYLKVTFSKAMLSVTSTSCPSNF